MGQMVPLSLEIPVRACTSSVIPVLITASLIHHHSHTKICLCLCVCRLHTDYKDARSFEKSLKQTDRDGTRVRVDTVMNSNKAEVKELQEQS